MTIYGYARVSSTDQNLARQFDSFISYGIMKENVYADKESGKDFERKNYKKLIKRIKSGDLLVIKSIDRLGRNYDSIIKEWQYITKKINADIVVLDMPLLDTREKKENLMGKFVSDLILQILSFVAENERTNIRQRQFEGIQSAKARGVKFGRPKKILSADFIETVKCYVEKEITLSAASKKLNISKNLLCYYANLYRKEKMKNSTSQ